MNLRVFGCFKHYLTTFGKCLFICLSTCAILGDAFYNLSNLRTNKGNFKKLFTFEIGADPGSRNCAARQRALQIILYLEDKSFNVFKNCKTHEMNVW